MEEKKKKKYFEDLKISKPVGVAIIVFVTVLLACTLFLVNRHLGNDKSGTKGDIIEITIPKNYYTYIGTSTEDAVETYNKMGNDFCKSAHVINGNVVIKVTETQRKNLIKQNDDKIKTILAEYQRANKKYVFEEKEGTLIYRYDEKLNAMTEQKAIVAVVSLYGLNYILENNKTDWKVNVEVYNCHNDKLIQKATAPNDVVMVKYDQWLESYKKEVE